MTVLQLGRFHRRTPRSRNPCPRYPILTYYRGSLRFTVSFRKNTCIQIVPESLSGGKGTSPEAYGWRSLDVHSDMDRSAPLECRGIQKHVWRRRRRPCIPRKDVFILNVRWGAHTFQHSRSILHLDLKPGNVLLTWDEGRLMCAIYFNRVLGGVLILAYRPRAMLSDFGTSRDMLNTSTTRSGNTGTCVVFTVSKPTK